MRIPTRAMPMGEGDMTPMIDMTFQLIAFFMVLLNFSEADQSDRVKLPMSELARPAESPFEYPVFIPLTRDKSVVLGGEEVPLTGLRPYMEREVEFLRLQQKTPSDATVIGRADAGIPEFLGLYVKKSIYKLLSTFILIGHQFGHHLSDNLCQIESQTT